MTDCVEPVSLTDVFLKYLRYHNDVCPGEEMKLSWTRELKSEARRVLLLSGENPRKSWTSPHWYQTLLDSLRNRNRDLHKHIADSIKGAERLEVLCVNLFLFPWRKEFKKLKTFTAQFVYYLQPILPFTQSVLQNIGYRLESDSEYRLSNGVDVDKAKEMGFNLFLIRVECEGLLEHMSHRSQGECLEILQKKASVDVPTQNDGQQSGLLVNPEERPIPKPRQRRKPPVTKSQGAIACGLQRPSSSLMSDSSLLEIQENYPDLAIRQTPIFGRRQKSGQAQKATPDLYSGPQSLILHNKTSPDVKSSGDTQLQLGTEDSVSEMVEKMRKMSVKDFHVDKLLKYPIEEMTPPTHTPTLASVSGCRSSAGPEDDDDEDDDAVKEPPYSIYFCDSPSRCRSGSRTTPEESPAHHETQQHRTASKPPEDDLLKTYAMI